MAWRFLATRLNGDGTEDVIHPNLPLSGPTITKTLSGPQAISGTIAPAFLSLLDSTGHSILTPWSTAIYAEEDHVIRAAGILTEPSITGSELRLSAVGWTAAIKDQPYQGSVSFVEVDPLTVVRHIWDRWQALPGGNLALSLDRTTATGIKIGTKLEQVEFDTVNGPVSFEAGPVKLNEWETDDLGGKIDNLAEEHGFEYRERHQWAADGSKVLHYLDFAVPGFGGRRNIQLREGQNVLVPPGINRPESSYASGTLVRGEGSGATMNRAWEMRPGEYRLRRIDVSSDTDLSSVSACQKRARERLGHLTGQPDVTDLEVTNTTMVPLGSLVEGDEVEFHSDGPWGREVIPVRIISTTYSPESGTIQLSVLRSDRMTS